MSPLPFWIATAALAAFALVLRAHHLGAQILGGDEIHLLDLITTTPLARIPGTVPWGDVSIPLALYGRALSSLTPLAEMHLRLPVLLSGALLPVVVAAGGRRLAGSIPGLLAGAVTVVHPLFLFYGRFVRPYGIAAMLLFGAVVLVDRWHRDPRAARGSLAGAVLLAGLATWFHLLSTVFVAALLASAMIRVLLARPRRPWRGLAVAGVAYGVLVFVLFAPALGGIREQVLEGKIGGGTLDGYDVQRNAAVLAGFPGTAPAILLAALAIAGAWMLARRDRGLALFLVLIPVLHTLLILVLRPALLQFSFVLARYLLDILPLVILLACVPLGGLAGLARESLARRGVSRPGGIAAAGGAAAVVLAGAAWFTLGPQASIYGGTNAWSHHNAYQTFTHLTAWPQGLWRRKGRRGMKATVPRFYETLGDERLLLEWPCPKPFDENPYALYQWRHRRPMKLLAVEGEQPWTSPRLALRNVIVVPREGPIEDLGGASLVILHTNFPAEVHASLSMQPGEHSFEPYRIPGIVASLSRRIAARCGPPVHEDRFLRVFRVPGP